MDALARILGGLLDPDPVVRRQALAAAGDHGLDVIAPLLRAQSLPHDVRSELPRAIAAYGSAAVPVLRQLLNSPDGADPVLACIALREIGHPAGAAAPELAREYRRGGEFLGYASGSALACIGPEGVEELRKVLAECTDAWLKYHTAEFLRMNGSPAAQEILRQCLRSSDRDIRESAAQWLLDPDVGPPIPQALLSEARKSQDPGEAGQK